MKYGIPEEVVKTAWESQFECARASTKVGISGEPETFVNIRFKHLGLLLAVARRIIKAHERRNNSNTDLEGL